jgi:hypothetical protein
MKKYSNSRDKIKENATLRDIQATTINYIKHAFLYTRMRFLYFTRRATVLWGVFSVCVYNVGRVLRVLPSKFLEGHSCRVSRDHAPLYININNSLSIYTHVIPYIFHVTFSRDAPEGASRRDSKLQKSDSLLLKTLALSWGFVWFLV